MQESENLVGGVELGKSGEWKHPASAWESHTGTSTFQ